MLAERSRTPFTVEPAPPTVTAEPTHYLRDLWGEYAFWRLLNDLRFIRDHYGIRVRVGRRTPLDLEGVSFERDAPTPHVASCDVASFREILGQYPPEFIRFCDITQARIVEKLLVGNYKYWKGNKAVGGYASSEGPIYVTGYDLEDIVHHEIFHRADQTSLKLENGRRKQHGWKRLNDPSRPYLYGAYWRLTPEQMLILPYQGFAEPYGRVDIWEDRATVAALLMTNPKKAKIRMAKDEILAQKACIIYGDLYRWSGGRMNGPYFDALKKGEVDEEYWVKHERKLMYKGQNQ